MPDCRARAHARPAGDAHHARQGVRQRLRAARAGDRRHRARADQGKVNGAVGNYNAHVVAYPALDWERFAARVVAGWAWNSIRTRRRSAARLHGRALRSPRPAPNTVAGRSRPRRLGLTCRWATSGSAMREGEVGSSTMPHKVNPIDFVQNSEATWASPTPCLRHLAGKRSCPCPRWQRDLTDSTVLRNMGVALGYTRWDGWSACARGSGSSRRAGAARGGSRGELEVLAEPIQTLDAALLVPNPL